MLNFLSIPVARRLRVRVDRDRLLNSFQNGDSMLFPAEKECSHLGETCSRLDYDLIHELSRRIDSVARCDQYIANAQKRDAVRQFWCNLKSQEEQNVQLLKELLAEEMRYVTI